MMIKILLTLLLTSIGVSAEAGSKERPKLNTTFPMSVIDAKLLRMEEYCNFLEKERLAKRHKVDAVTDEGSAIKIALDEGFARFYVTPRANTRGYALLAGKHEEYWLVLLGPVMEQNKRVVEEYNALISRNNGAYLCGYLFDSHSNPMRPYFR